MTKASKFTLNYCHVNFLLQEDVESQNRQKLEVGRSVCITEADFIVNPPKVGGKLGLADWLTVQTNLKKKYFP